MLTFDDCLALTGIEPERGAAVNGMDTVSALRLMSRTDTDESCDNPLHAVKGDAAP